MLAAANLVIDFDDTIADELFTINMDLDEPRAERRERFSAWKEDHQLSRAFTTEALTMLTPLKGTVTVSAAAEPAAQAPSITVSLDHLGEVQTITLNS